MHLFSCMALWIKVPIVWYMICEMTKGLKAGANRLKKKHGHRRKKSLLEWQNSTSHGTLTHADRLWSGLEINKHGCRQKMPWNKRLSLSLIPGLRVCVYIGAVSRLHCVRSTLKTYTYAQKHTFSFSSGAFSLTWRGNINPRRTDISWHSCQGRTGTCLPSVSFESSERFGCRIG